MKPLLRILFWLVVGASLLANAVVLGLWLRLSPLRDAFMGGGEGFRDLPADLRQTYRAVLAEREAALREHLAALGRARAAMFRAAAAEPPDRAAVEAAMAAVRESSAALQAAAQQVLLDALDRGSR